MPSCVLKRGNLCDRMSSRENKARFLHQNEVNLRDRETKWPAANLDLFCMHLHRQPNANTKLDLRSPIVDRDKSTFFEQAYIVLKWFCCIHQKTLL